MAKYTYREQLFSKECVQSLNNAPINILSWPDFDSAAYVFSSNIRLFLKYNLLSYNVTVIRWITACHTYCYDHTLHSTFGGNKKRHGDARYNEANFSLK